MLDRQEMGLSTRLIVKMPDRQPAGLSRRLTVKGSDCQADCPSPDCQLSFYSIVKFLF
jgi:hypothetical protein